MESLSPVESQIKTLIELIYDARTISDEKKQALIKALEKEGITESILKELSEIFTKEADQLEGEATREKEILGAAQEEIDQARLEIDEPQARLLSALSEVHEEGQNELESKYQELGTAIEKVQEGASEQEKHEEIASIRAKLQQK